MVQWRGFVPRGPSSGNLWPSLPPLAQHIISGMLSGKDRSMTAVPAHVTDTHIRPGDLGKNEVQKDFFNKRFIQTTMTVSA